MKPREMPETPRDQERAAVEKETARKLEDVRKNISPEISAWSIEKDDPAFVAEREMIRALPDVDKDRDNPYRWVSEGGMRTNPTSEMLRYFTTTPVRVQYNTGTRLWEYQTGDAGNPWKVVGENTYLMGVTYPKSSRDMVEIARKANAARKNERRE